MFNEIQTHIKMLDKSIKSLRSTGTNYAAAERDYKMKLRQEALRLRSDGEAIGMIDKCVYGVPEVAQARFERDVAEAVYKANLESIQATKLKIKVLENQYDKEWGNAK